MEKVAQMPCQEFLHRWKSGAACDEHLADQMVLPMAFATGSSSWTTPVVTEHLRTVIWVVQQFVNVEVKVDEHRERGGTVSVSLFIAWFCNPIDDRRFVWRLN
jgi:RNA 3'-terminal phosphate cyclase (ATP)